MRMRQLGVAQVALVLCSLLLVPAVVSAQDAGISGVVSDDTGGGVPVAYKHMTLPPSDRV